MEWIKIDENNKPALKYSVDAGEDSYKYSEEVAVLYLNNKYVNSVYDIARFEKGQSGWEQWYSKAYDDVIEPPTHFCFLPEKPNQ